MQRGRQKQESDIQQKLEFYYMKNRKTTYSIDYANEEILKVTLDYYKPYAYNIGLCTKFKQTRTTYRWFSTCYRQKLNKSSQTNDYTLGRNRIGNSNKTEIQERYSNFTSTINYELTFSPKYTFCNNRNNKTFIDYIITNSQIKDVSSVICKYRMKPQFSL